MSTIYYSALILREPPPHWDWALQIVQKAHHMAKRKESISRRWDLSLGLTMRRKAPKMIPRYKERSEGKAFSMSRVVDMTEDKVKKIQTISPGWCGSGYVRKASHWKPHWQPLNPPLDSNQKRAFAPKVQFDQHCDQPKSFCVLCECAWMLFCAFWWGC